MVLTQTSAGEDENALNVVRLGLELPAAAVSAFEEFKQKFSNQRQWREFASAVQCSVNYPAAINSLRSGTKWFNDGLAQVHAFARTLHARCR